MAAFRFLAVAALFALARAASEATLDNVQVVVAKKGADGQEFSADFPNAITDTISASGEESVTVSFRTLDKASGDAIRPHQVFVRFTHEESDTQTHFVARRRSGEGDHVAKVDVGPAARKFFDFRSGNYRVEVIVGDVSIRPVVYALATVTLDLGKAPPAKEDPLYTKPLLDESDTATAPLREYGHQFREPERRPPAMVSLVFAALVFVPSAVFVFGMFGAGANFRGFPGGLGALWALGFHVAIGAFLALFALYWFQLNMFETLSVATPLSLVTVVVGNRALRAVALAHGDVVADKRA